MKGIASISLCYPFPCYTQLFTDLYLLSNLSFRAILLIPCYTQERLLRYVG
jgi:hypothetical protein